MSMEMRIAYWIALTLSGMYIWIQDESMEPRYQVGDIVLIKKTLRVGEGETALVLIRNQHAAIRNLLETGDEDYIFLFATNLKCPRSAFQRLILG